MPDSKRLRIVVDTNLWISFLISNSLRGFDELLRQPRVTFLFSDALVKEIRDTAALERFRKFFPSDEADELLHRIQFKVVPVVVSSAVTASRDVNDDFLLVLAKDGHADF